MGGRRIFKTLNDPSSSCAASWVSYLLTAVILLTAAPRLDFHALKGS